MRGRRQLREEDKARIKDVLSQLLGREGAVRFACFHGSFLEPHGFRDVDIAVWVDPARVSREAAMDYEFKLSALLERSVSCPVDVKVLNYAPLGFQHAATNGELIFSRDAEEWLAFRERTWRDYLDFAPIAKEALRDLLSR